MLQPGQDVLRSQFRRDVTATQAHADVAVTLATAQEAALRVEQGRMLQGWALAMRGDAAAGVAYIHQGLATLKGVGPELLRPYWLSLLSEAYGQARQPESGLQVVAEAGDPVTGRATFPPTRSFSYVCTAGGPYRQR